MEPDHEESRRDIINYLENLQARVYEQYNIRPFHTNQRPLSISEKRKMFETMGGYSKDQTFEEFLAQWTEQDAKDKALVLTRFEEPAWYGVMHRTMEEILPCLDSLQFKNKIPGPHILGTLPSNRMNGLAISKSGNPFRILILESGLFPLANLLTKVVVNSMPMLKSLGRTNLSTNVEECCQHIDKNPHLQQRFYDAVGAYLITGNAHNARNYYLPPAYNFPASILRDGLECFVLSHELGHLLAGHLNEDATCQMHMIGSANCSVIKPNWAEEFEADRVGMDIAVAAMRRRKLDVAMSYWGCDFFFRCLKVVDNAMSVIRTGKVEDPPVTDSHPPVMDRIRAMREYLHASYNPASSMGAIKLGDSLQAVMDHLWKKVEPRFIQLHTSGCEVRPQFLPR